MAMHMSNQINQMNQSQMNLTPLQQQQLVQQQQASANPQQILQHQQQTPVPNPNPAAAIPNPGAEQQKLDHIAKVKTLIWPLKESLIVIIIMCSLQQVLFIFFLLLQSSIKTAAQNFNQNGLIDFGTM